MQAVSVIDFMTYIFSDKSICILSRVPNNFKTTFYFCFADATLPEIEISTSSVEHIQNLNPVSVVIGTRVTMLPGGRLQITCSASGIPEPSISWLRRNKQITSSGRFSIVNTTLIIQPIELDDRGSFTCAANNTLGRQTYSTTVDIVG